MCAFIYKWLKKTVFTHRSPEGQSLGPVRPPPETGRLLHLLPPPVGLRSAAQLAAVDPAVPDLGAGQGHMYTASAHAPAHAKARVCVRQADHFGHAGTGTYPQHSSRLVC